MRTTVVFLIAAYALGSVLSQPLIDSQGIDVASEGVLVPEIQPVGVPQAAPAAALATPELAATTGMLTQQGMLHAAFVLLAGSPNQGQLFMPALGTAWVQHGKSIA